MQIGDWLEDLAEFPAQYVALACAEWRQTQQNRPLPYDIRVLVIAELRRRGPTTPPPALITDMAGEPMPAADVVREHWRKIPRSLLTEAETALFTASAGDVTSETLRQIASAPTSSAKRTA